MFSKRTGYIFFIASILLLSILVINAIRRDLLYEVNQLSDLRNRVVGARLIADGKSPYFYQWKPGDSKRYYDPGASYGVTKVSNITASPFFHELIVPLGSFDQKTIAVIWVFAVYLMCCLIVIITFRAASNDLSKLLVLVSATAFLYTEAWIHHIFWGQIYITIPFFMAILFWIHSTAGTRPRYILMGIVGTILVLIRPNALIFFLPLLISFRFLNLKSIMQFFISPVIAVLIILASSFQKELWIDYFNAINQYTVLHQNAEPPQTAASSPKPLYSEWEGIVMNDNGNQLETLKQIPTSENGNFFVLVNKIFSTNIGTVRLMVISVSLILFILFIFYKFENQGHKGSSALVPVYILGFCLYMINDLFSPISRHQYYTVQWLLVILLFFSQVKLPKDRLFAILISTGVVLNIITTPLIKMEHTIGEYLLLCTLIVYSLVSIKGIEVEDNYPPINMGS